MQRQRQRWHWDIQLRSTTANLLSLLPVPHKHYAIMADLTHTEASEPLAHELAALTDEELERYVAEHGR